MHEKTLCVGVLTTAFSGSFSTPITISIHSIPAHFLAFTIAGALYGLRWCYAYSYGGFAVDPWSARGNELNAIVSCVLGELC